MKNQNNKTAIIASEGLMSEAQTLSQRLGLCLITKQDPSTIDEYFAVLILDNDKLSLQQTGKDAPGAIYVDFASGASNHRRKYGGGKSQMIAKAIGLNKFKNPHVLDATAGLGKDSFVLASLGCKVDMVERNPIVHALLEDGFTRAKQDGEISDIINNMSLAHQDAFEYISNLEEKPDIIYLDPMFPSREKSALVKKEMRIFKEILGTGDDSDKLLEASLNKAKHRVVVKRPRKSPYLFNKEPSYKLEGKANRFDIYVVGTSKIL